MGTHSIFESLILKQYVLYYKTIITHGLHSETKLYYGFIFGAIGINVTWQWRRNGFSPKSNFSLIRHFFLKVYATYSLDECLLLCEVSQKSIRGFRDILEFLQKGFKLCMHWRLDLIQTNLLLFGCFRKGFITYSFCKWSLYTCKPLSTSIHSRDSKTHENVWIRVKRNAELFL